MKSLSHYWRHVKWKVRTHLPFLKQNYQFYLQDGIIFEYPIKMAIGRALLVHGSFEDEEARIIKEALSSGDIFIDVGAHAGSYSLIASKRIGEKGRVFAIEPDPQALQLLARNIELNSVTNIEVVPIATGYEKGEVLFHCSIDPAFSSMKMVHRPEYVLSQAIPVAMDALDNLIPTDLFSRVRCIKVDVEGAELQVIKGASQLLKRSSRLIVLFECYSPNASAYGYTPEELWNTFNQLGFSVYSTKSWISGKDRVATPTDLDSSYNFVAEKT